jgi:hypothetical protein
MALTPEEEKAVKYRQDAEKRLAYGRFLQAQLKPDPARAVQTKKNWSPLLGRRIP